MIVSAVQIKSQCVTMTYIMLITEDILERMMDDSTACDSRSLIGHSGPIYAVSFSSDRQYLLSCSEDGTGW